MKLSIILAGLAACAHAAHHPVSLTYLGVAGWQLEAAGRVILADPYLSRPADPDQPLVPDAAAIAAHTPARADLVIVGHSHYDHLLDAPAVAIRTGAQLLGSASTVRVARASGVADDRIITIKGGEDYELDGFSIRVIPSLHSVIGAFGEPIIEAHLPMPAAGYQEGGTFAYLVRIAGREVFFLDTANFIESELVNVHPEIAILAIGTRERIHDYTCRLVHALGDPPIVIANHFDDWKGPPVDAPPSSDAIDFIAEVRKCSPHTRVIIPHHFEGVTL